MNKDCSQSTLRAHPSSSRAHASSSFPTVFDPASPALFFTRTRVLTSKERQSIFQDWGADAGPVVRGLNGQWSKKKTLAQGTSISVRFDARVVPSWSCTTRIHYVGTTSGRVVARVDRLAGTAFHPAPVTDGCKRPSSPKPPTSRCNKPRPVCSPLLKAYSPVQERALPRGTTGGSGGSHSVRKSGHNYFSTHDEQLYERNEASARSRYMGDFQEREQGKHAEIEVVRPDTPPTPGGPGSEENTTMLVTLDTAVGGLVTPPTPGDTCLEARAATPPTPRTPVVRDLFESLPGSPNDLFSPPTPDSGEGGDTCPSPFLSPSLSPTQAEDSPPTPGRTVTQVNWVAQSVAELEVNDPEMAAFVVEFDKGAAQAHIAPFKQGHTTQGVGGVSVQSKGIKKTFPCLWLPVSVCVASRVHSLLSACPAFNRIDSRVQTVTFPPGPEVAPTVCVLTSRGLSLVNQRRKGV